MTSIDKIKWCVLYSATAKPKIIEAFRPPYYFDLVKSDLFRSLHNYVEEIEIKLAFS